MTPKPDTLDLSHAEHAAIRRWAVEHATRHLMCEPNAWSVIEEAAMLEAYVVCGYSAQAIGDAADVPRTPA